VQYYYSYLIIVRNIMKNLGQIASNWVKKGIFSSMVAMLWRGYSVNHASPVLVNVFIHRIPCNLAGNVVGAHELAS